MLTSTRTPCDHFLSAGLNSFFTTKNLSISLQAGAISYFAIKTSNNIAKKDYKNALISGLSGVLINNILGENTMNNHNPYLNNNQYMNNFHSFHNNNNCPYNPYINNQANNPYQNNQNGLLNSLFKNNPNSVFGSPLVKGILIGAAVAYLLSNKEAKDTLAKGVAKIQSFASATIEEFKEQIEDAKANMQE